MGPLVSCYRQRTRHNIPVCQPSSGCTPHTDPEKSVCASGSKPTTACLWSVDICTLRQAFLRTGMRMGRRDFIHIRSEKCQPRKSVATAFSSKLCNRLKQTFDSVPPITLPNFPIPSMLVFCSLRLLLYLPSKFYSGKYPLGSLCRTGFGDAVYNGCLSHPFPQEDTSGATLPGTKH